MSRRLSPIETMIDRAGLRCTKCNAPYGTCACWERVTLECPQCGKRKRVEKDRTDPPNTARVMLECNECSDGESDRSIAYFDAGGRQIDADGEPII